MTSADCQINHGHLRIGRKRGKKIFGLLGWYTIIAEVPGQKPINKAWTVINVSFENLGSQHPKIGESSTGGKERNYRKISTR